MAKNKFSSAQIEKIQSMSYKELGKAVVTGEYNIKDLRRAYSQMRDVAVKRVGRLTTEKNVKQFGKPNLYIENGEYFRKTKSLVSTSELLKEIADVSKFLTSKKSTISGLKEIRSEVISNLQESGFDVDTSDYVKVLEFMKWFKASEFSKEFDSDSPVVAEVFNSERADPDSWRRAFEEYKNAEKSAPVRQY